MPSHPHPLIHGLFFGIDQTEAKLQPQVQLESFPTIQISLKVGLWVVLVVFWPFGGETQAVLKINLNPLRTRYDDWNRPDSTRLSLTLTTWI